MAFTRYHQACDASAAARIADTTLFVAASDEDCLLRVYDRTTGGAPVSSLDVTAFLQPDDPDELEADIEGCASIGDRIFWIGSHGRNKNRKERKIRQRLFATTTSSSGTGAVQLRPSGVPYKNLLRDLATASTLADFNLKTAATLAPEEQGGLNIEGLAATPEGHLLIGFSNPLPLDRALIVRLTNPAALVDGDASVADVQLGGLLDLGGRGIRALEFVPSLGIYLVLAGATGDGGDFALFRWSGEASQPAVDVKLAELAQLNVEELLAVEHANGGLELHLLSDDGAAECKAAAPERRRFRALTVAVPAGALAPTALLT